MSNAALYLNPEAFDTRRPALMGRHSAGESFLRGYLRHARAERFAFWNVANSPEGELRSMLERLSPLRHPTEIMPRHDRHGLARIGNVHLPQPNLAREAWQRRTIGLSGRYGISGITHTTAGMDIMDSLADLLTAPIEPGDALICTSRAVKSSVETQLEAVRADLEQRLGATRLPEPRLVTIPLGINTDDFQIDGGHRARWRTRLSIPDEAVVVLYVGRFNAPSKMNPVPMALALERAAKASDRPVAWVQAGWAQSESLAKTFHDECRAQCPSVLYRIVDGREPETRFSIWSVGDIFISLTDNVQETFGLTPLEAMAAGLPCVVSDWNGYRETVRHGVDGYRVATYAPPPGLGRDLAYQHANQWIGYDQYVGRASQMIAVDVGEAAQALQTLIEDPERRAAMGRSAQQRARDAFDWKAVIPQYEDLWADMTRRRRAVPPSGGGPGDRVGNPRRMDPFLLFGNYATQWATRTTLVRLIRSDASAAVKTLLGTQLANYGPGTLPSIQELELVLEPLASGRQISVDELLDPIAENRRPFVHRGILWLAKYDIVAILRRDDRL